MIITFVKNYRNIVTLFRQNTFFQGMTVSGDFRTCSDSGDVGASMGGRRSRAQPLALLAAAAASLFGAAGSSSASVWKSAGPATHRAGEGRPGKGGAGGGVQMHSKSLLLADRATVHDAGHALDMMSVDAGLTVHRDAAQSADDIVKQLILKEEASIAAAKKGPAPRPFPLHAGRRSRSLPGGTERRAISEQGTGAASAAAASATARRPPMAAVQTAVNGESESMRGEGGTGVVGRDASDAGGVADSGQGLADDEVGGEDQREIDKEASAAGVTIPLELPPASSRQGGKDEGEDEDETDSGGRDLFDQAARQVGYGAAADVSSRRGHGVEAVAAAAAGGEQIADAEDASRGLARDAPVSAASSIARSGAASTASPSHATAAEAVGVGGGVGLGSLSGGLLQPGGRVGSSSGETMQEHVHAEAVKARRDEQHAVKQLVRARQMEQQVPGSQVATELRSRAAT